MDLEWQTAIKPEIHAQPHAEEAAKTLTIPRRVY
jgi:hypothetical protein